MTQVFINLPVTDLERAKTYYTALGCEINPLFTNDQGACVVWSEDIYFMLLIPEFFATFTDREVVDPARAAQVIIAMSRESRAAVDQIAEAGLAAGGRESRPPEEHGFMYQRSVQDPDGNLLEFMYMEPEAVELGPEEYVAQQGG